MSDSRSTGRRLLVALGLWVLAAAGWAGDEAAPPPAPEPGESRAEAWRRLREERQAQCAARPPGRIEHSLVAFEKQEGPQLLNAHYLDLYPQITTLASGSRLAGGVRLWSPGMGGGPIDLQSSALYSLAGYQYYDVQVGLIPHAPDRLPVRGVKEESLYELGRAVPRRRHQVVSFAAWRHRDYPQEDFYGLGTGAPRSDRSNYHLRQDDYMLVTGYQFGSRFGAALQGGLVDARLSPGEDDGVPTTQDLFDDATAPGLDSQPDFLRLGGYVTLDLRDEVFNPHKGVFVAAGAARYKQHGGDGEFDFQRVGVDARAFLPLFSEQRVLALHAFFSRDRPDDGARVPFYLMDTLGGGYSLRGYHGLRFRDATEISLQAEYRWEANTFVELALFAEFAKAAPRPSDLDAAPWRTSYGFGTRFKAPTAVVLRLDLGWSDELTRFFIRFGPSF